MKIKSLIALFAAAALLTSSCSLFKGVESGGSKPGKTEVQAPKNDKNKKKKGSKGDSVPKTNTSNVKPTQDELSGGEWTVTGVNELNITAEENVPYVNFGRDGRFYASDGCNVLNGDYVLRSDGVLALSSVLSTMKYCPDVEYAPAITARLSDDSRYTVDCRRIGQETYLYFKDKAGKTVMTLRRHNMEFLNGNWRVTAIDGKEINDEEANIFIDIAELKVHGNTGCNYFNGDLYIDTQRSNAIDFSDMATTRMACPKGDQERMMLVALEEAKTAIAGKHDDTVLLLNRKGKEVLQLKRIPLPAEEE